MTEREKILAEIEAFLLRAKISAPYFGLYVLNDKGFVGRLRRGSEVKTRTIDKVRAYIAAEDKKRPKTSRTPKAAKG